MAALNILVYIPNFGNDSGGIRQYSSVLLNILNKDLENNYFIYHDKDDPEIIGKLNLGDNHKIVKNSDMHRLLLRNKSFYGRRVLNFIFRSIRFNRKLYIPDAFDFYCINSNIDIIHCPYQYIPEIPNIKTICTMHDVQELHFPAFFSPEERALRSVTYLKYISKSSHIIVSYDHVKKDLETFFNVDSKKISTILLDMEYLWFNRFLGTIPVDLSGLKLPKRFLFFAANTWVHKNHIKLIEAIAELKTEGLLVYLVCCGHQNENMSKINDAIHIYKLEDQIKFLGIVSEEVLYSLYKQTAGVVIPTLYEAGSFPLIESIYLGSPVICANVTSLPETIGDKRFLFDPTNINEIKERVKTLWSDSSFAKASAENATSRKSKFENLNSLLKIKTLYTLLSSGA